MKLKKSKNIIEINGEKFELRLETEDTNNPCKKCYFNGKCLDAVYDFMPCGCEFSTEPYYCVKI